MTFGISTRVAAAALTLTCFSGVGALAQDDQGAADNEYGVGFYLGNCDSLVAGAALYDLGDAELETEDFSMADENQDEDEGTDLEGQIEEESEGDETDVESAVEGNGSGDDGDEEVVIQGARRPVYVAGEQAFGATLVDLVDAPFAVAIRQSADDSATAEGGDGEGEEFVACGEFGGAVAGDEIIIPLDELDGSGFSGIALLRTGENEGESVSSVYLFGQGEIEGEGEGDGAAEGGAATPTA